MGVWNKEVLFHFFWIRVNIIYVHGIEGVNILWMCLYTKKRKRDLNFG